MLSLPYSFSFIQHFATLSPTSSHFHLYLSRNISRIVSGGFYIRPQSVRLPHMRPCRRRIDASEEQQDGICGREEWKEALDGLLNEALEGMRHILECVWYDIGCEECHIVMLYLGRDCGVVENHIASSAFPIAHANGVLDRVDENEKVESLIQFGCGSVEVLECDLFRVWHGLLKQTVHALEFVAQILIVEKVHAIALVTDVLELSTAVFGECPFDDL